LGSLPRGSAGRSAHCREGSRPAWTRITRRSGWRVERAGVDQPARRAMQVPRGLPIELVTVPVVSPGLQPERRRGVQHQREVEAARPSKPEPARSAGSSRHLHVGAGGADLGAANPELPTARSELVRGRQPDPAAGSVASRRGAATPRPSRRNVVGRRANATGVRRRPV